MVPRWSRAAPIGKVFSIESRVVGTVGAMYGWRAFKAYGGGMVYDWGVHMFDQLLWMYPDKKIVDVKAELMSILEANKEVDDYFKVLLKPRGRTGFDGRGRVLRLPRAAAVVLHRRGRHPGDRRLHRGEGRHHAARASARRARLRRSWCRRPRARPA